MNRNCFYLVVLPDLLADAASFHTIFLFFAYTGELTADQARMLVWRAFLAAVYVALTLFLRRPWGDRHRGGRVSRPDGGEKRFG